MSVTCPECGSQAFKRNGYTRHGKQNHRCLDCGRQFSLELKDEEVVSSHFSTVGEALSGVLVE